MSRMHKSRRGKSGSRRPLVSKNPDWVDIDAEEIEETVVKLSKQGHSASEIGVILRDQHGVPDIDIATGKSVTDILKENNLEPEIPEDLMNLMERAVNLYDHLEKHPKNLKNRRGLQLVEAKIRKLANYYREKGRLTEDWKYTKDKAEMLTQ